MKTVLEAIKIYPEEFISTLDARSQTTPSRLKKGNHELMIELIKGEVWDVVSHLIQLPVYTKPFEGVIYCLERYSNIDKELWCAIVDLYRDGKFV